MNAPHTVPNSPRSITAYERAYRASDFEPVQARGLGPLARSQHNIGHFVADGLRGQAF